MDYSFPFLAGIIAAILHVIMGPDHLIAVAPFAIERVKKAWKIGLLWGVGHLSGMLLIGILFLLFKDLIPIEEISGYSEKFVGIMLILLGVWILVKIFIMDRKIHKHLHIHTKEDNVLIHEHHHHHYGDKGQRTHEHNHKKQSVKQGDITTFFVGLVHGLAGIAHFLLFLPVIGFTSKAESLQYIVGFGVGTLLAMISFTFIMGKIASFSQRDFNPSFFQGIRIASAVVAIVFGVYWFVAN